MSHLGYSLGERTFTVEESAQADRITSEPAVFQDAGFRKHHLCGDETTAYDLARNTVKAMEADLRNVGALVYATCIPLNGNVGSVERFAESGDVKHLMDFPASRLQADLGLDRAIVIGLNQQACTGMLGSLRIARMLLQSEPEVGSVLCVTADRFPAGAGYEQAYNLISDGGAGCIVSHVPEGFRLVACHSITNGGLSQASDDETVGTYFNYSHRIITETLERANMEVSDLDWIVPQNTNVKAWQILSRLIGIDMDRIHFGAIEEVAHVISGDNIINLSHLDASGKLRPGDRILLTMAGYGLNWQCTIVEKR